MAETTQISKIKLFSPMVLILLVVLFLLGGYLGITSYLEGTIGGGAQSFHQKMTEVAALSKQIAIGTEATLANNKSGDSILTDAVGRMDKLMIAPVNLGLLAAVTSVPEKHQSKVNELAGLWSEMKDHVSELQKRKGSIKYLAEASTDISITMSAMQQELEKVVTDLVTISASADQVTWTQKLNFITERLSHSLSRNLLLSAENNLGENIVKDIRLIKKVLSGLLKGDRSLGLINAVSSAKNVSALGRIDEIFRPVFAQKNEILLHSKKVAMAKISSSAIQTQASEMTRISESMINGALSGIADAGGLINLGVLASMLVLIVLLLILIFRNAKKGMGSGSGGEGDNHQAAILQLLDELADLADGDLTVQATVTESFTGAIADSINYSIDQMRGLVSKINETARKVSQASDQTRKSASNLSIASQRQAKEIADVSRAVNEMAISIDKVSLNAAESSSVAEKSVEIANKGALTVQNTIGGMDRIRGTIQETAKRIKRLGESSQEIGDIVSLINEIADQTNILSLNAAIQASMAGDAGKGFAVVADEVQRLAERSGAAAKQISALVKTIQSDTNEAVSSMEQTTTEVVQGTRLAQEAGVALGEIEGVSKSMEEIIAKISQAATEQGVSAGKISKTMKSIQEITSKTTEGTKATANSVGNLAAMTEELRLSVTGFKLPHS